MNEVLSIFHAKRKYMGEVEAGVDAARAAVELKSRREVLKNFIAETHRRMDSSRTSVSGFGRSAAAKATAAVKKRNEEKQDGLLQTLHITPQPITMESIQRVRIVTCDTLNKNASHRLKTECKQLLMFARKQPESVGTGRLYDLNMNQLTERLTDEVTENRIRMPDKHKLHVALHIHPDCAILSHGDLLTFTKRKNARMIIALGHDEHCYAAEKIDNYDGISALSVAVEIAQLVNVVTKGALTAEQYLQKVIEEMQIGEKKMEQYGVKFYEW